MGEMFQAELTDQMVYQRHIDGFLVFSVCGVWFNPQDLLFFPTYWRDGDIIQSRKLCVLNKTGRWIMSRNTIMVFMYHLHTLLDLILYWYRQIQLITLSILPNHHLPALGHARSVPSSWKICWSLHLNWGHASFHLLLKLCIKIFFRIRLSSLALPSDQAPAAHARQHRRLSYWALGASANTRRGYISRFITKLFFLHDASDQCDSTHPIFSGPEFCL
jgi:hypothetical protein